MSLRWRLAFILGGSVAIAIGVAAVASFASADREFRHEVDELLVARTSLVVENPGQAFGGEFGGRRPRFFDDDDGPALAEFDTVTQIIDPTATRVFRFSEGPSLPVDEVDLELARAGGKVVFRDVEVDEVPFRMMTTPLEDGGAVQVARDVSEVDAVLTGLRGRLLVLGGLGVALAALVGWLVARRTVAPIEELTEAAEHVAETQDLASPIETTRTDELGSLANSFNTMLAALEESRSQQHRLVMDASHELRTPLTSLRTNIELLQRADDMDPAERGRLIDDVNLELVELSHLVSELVDLATDRHTEEPLSEFRLDRVVADAAETARRRTGRVIEVDAEAGALTGRPAMLERAVANLLDNAHKWSPERTPIEVTVQGGRVAVRDHGSGIPVDDRPRVFERFYRAPESRTMVGSGLGLAIVKQIVESHNGRVFAEEAPGGGAVVGFEVPTEAVPAEAATT